MKNSKFGLRNFRVFDDKGASFDIAPITIITGGNSSGKSSVFKSLMLLNESLRNFTLNYKDNKEFNLFDLKLQFHTGKHNLGTFDKTISRLAKTEKIILSYTLYSYLVNEDINVEYTFKLDKNDFLRSAIVESIKLISEKETIISFTIDHEKRSVSMNCEAVKFKPSFVNVILAKKYFYDPISAELSENIHSPEDIKGFNKEDDVYQCYSNDNHNQLLNRCIKIRERLLDIDNVNQLLNPNESLNYNNLTMLFYLPIESIFGKTSKRKLMHKFDQILSEKGDIIDFNDETTQFSIRIIKKFIESCVNSGKKGLVEYYIALENEFLTKRFSNVEIKEALSIIYQMGSSISNKINYLNSFQGKLSMCNPPHCDFINTLQDPFYGNVNLFESEFQEKSLSDIPYDFETIFVALVLFFSMIDEDFSKNRIIGADTGQIFSYGTYFEYYKPLEFELFNIFITAFIQECLITLPSFVINNTFIDAVRSTSQRMYTFRNQGTEFNALLVNYLTELKVVKEDKKTSMPLNYKLGTFLNKWIKEFEIADEVKFELTEDGLGVHIYIVKENTETLLADEGYGITQLLSILLQIELNIAKSAYSYQHPFVLHSENRYMENTISIEEPEVNLHPKFQSRLADLFIDAYRTYNVRFMLETHSEYLIRKLQTLVARKEINKDDVSIHYIYSPDKKRRPKGVNHVERINIIEDGRLDKPFGVGFFDEADNLALDLLTIKSLN